VLRSLIHAGAALLAALLLITTGCARKTSVRVLPPPPAPAVAGSTETGIASWYGAPYHGRRTASGEVYDMQQLTAAHRTLPFETWVEVTDLDNGKRVEVRITDRGPFVDGRIIDLSHAAARAIGLIGPGVVRVRIDILSVPTITAAQNWYAVQAGAFLDQDRAERVRAALERGYGSARLVVRPGSPPLWRVLVGRAASERAADAIAQRMRQQEGSAFVVRLDDAPAPSTAVRQP